MNAATDKQAVTLFDLSAVWIYRQLKINGPDLPNALADHKFYAKRLKMGWNGARSFQLDERYVTKKFQKGLIY
jgi:hypothetical protein